MLNGNTPRIPPHILQYYTLAGRWRTDFLLAVADVEMSVT